MQDKVNQLEDLLNDILNSIKHHFKMEQKDLDEFDKFIDKIASPDDDEEYNHKNGNSIWDNNISKLLSLLLETHEKILAYKTNLVSIGGSDYPNNEIIQLIKQGILTASTTVSKFYKGNEVTGFLTEDGFLELEIKGTRNKFSLRAALFAFGINPPSQWKFWEVVGEDGERKLCNS